MAIHEYSVKTQGTTKFLNISVFGNLLAKMGLIQL